MGVDRASYDEGFADSGQVTAERGEVAALAGSLRDTLNDIEDALRKIDDGTYGVCEQCGGPIGEARLEAMPTARLRQARRITREFCRRHGIEYREMSWFAAAREVVAHFRTMSAFVPHA